MCATDNLLSPVVTRPTCSRIVFGGVPAASMIVGCSISSGTSASVPARAAHVDAGAVHRHALFTQLCDLPVADAGCAQAIRSHHAMPRHLPAVRRHDGAHGATGALADVLRDVAVG